MFEQLRQRATASAARARLQLPQLGALLATASLTALAALGSMGWGP